MEASPEMPVDNLPVAYRAPDERRFWTKLRRVVAQIPFAEDLLAGYYCAVDRATPTRVRAVLLGAVAYFVLPADAVPDLFVGHRLHRRRRGARRGADRGRPPSSAPASGAGPREPRASRRLIAVRLRAEAALASSALSPVGRLLALGIRRVRQRPSRSGLDLPLLEDRPCMRLAPCG